MFHTYLLLKKSRHKVYYYKVELEIYDIFATRSYYKIFLKFTICYVGVCLTAQDTFLK